MKQMSGGTCSVAVSTVKARKQRMHPQKQVALPQSLAQDLFVIRVRGKSKHCGTISDEVQVRPMRT